MEGASRTDRDRDDRFGGCARRDRRGRPHPGRRHQRKARSLTSGEVHDPADLRELAERSDETLDDVKRWFIAGLLTSATPSNIEAERVRLIGTLQRHGVPLELIA